VLDVMIYSLNRACQLQALLETWQRFVTGPPPKVLYCYTEPDFRRGYELCRGRFPWVRWVPQVHFRTDVLEQMLASRRPYAMFMVDDMLVRRPIRLNAATVSPMEEDEEIACVSLRLSPKISYCYSLERDAPPPAFETRGEWLVWKWPNLPGDWGYPMSLDAHIFRREEMLDRLDRLVWSNPNTQEASLAAAPLSRNKMACRPEHAVINIPANLVQSTFSNRTCRGPSAEDLNTAYLAGRAIDVDPLIQLETSSCHVAAEYRLEKWAADCGQPTAENKP
jgi:hypothetical protein